MYLTKKIKKIAITMNRKLPFFAKTLKGKIDVSAFKHKKWDFIAALPHSFLNLDNQMKTFK